MGPRVLITTSHRPSENARSFGKLLARIIPNSKFISRGTQNESMIFDEAISNNFNLIFFLYSSGNQLEKLLINEIKGQQIIEIKQYLKFYQYIDPKIFGWDRIPERGPISAPPSCYEVDKKLVDFLIAYFGLRLDVKEKIWLMIDKQKKKTYMQLIDSMTLKRILFAEVLVRGK